MARQAQAADVTFRAAVADCAYGDVDDFRGELRHTGLPLVMALKRRRGTWLYGGQAHTPLDAARELRWNGPRAPGDWILVTRTFRDGHAATWWAADATLGWWGPDSPTRLVVATTDPVTLPEKNTWYLATDLPRPGAPRATDSPHPRPTQTGGQRGGRISPTSPDRPCCPQAIRNVRSWLTPSITLKRWWQAWSTRPPPTQLQARIDAVTSGRPINLNRPD
ncbi:hypothetical protein ACIQU6_40810 [Streptomyces sp. NPDC090442]|uniref:hypothetical protein n=1 Tax=Streptomyces sp. NPDC090442 TaxID=3365962 RepID=UPI0037F27EC5